MNNKWNDMLHEAGVIDGKGITGIIVRQVPGYDADDIILCPCEDADSRIAQLSGSRGNRRLQAERVFMARALRNDAETAIALLVRAVIGRWVHARGSRTIDNTHERRTWAMLDDHLAAKGLRVDSEVTAGRLQISDTHIKAPIAHEGPIDVIRKAVGQIRKQIDGRHIIVFGTSPLAV